MEAVVDNDWKGAGHNSLSFIRFAEPITDGGISMYFAYVIEADCSSDLSLVYNGEACWEATEGSEAFEGATNIS